MQDIKNYIKKTDEIIYLFLHHKLYRRTLYFNLRAITQLGSFCFAAILCLTLLFWHNAIMHTAGLFLAFVIVLNQFVVQTIKRIVNRPRPYTVIKQASSVKPLKCKYSFPSGHTNTAFSIAFVLSHVFPVLSIVYFTLAGLVGISRIYLGYHYPTDVLVGFAASYIAFIPISHFINGLLAI
ncbi:MAG: phosphatase PAP2 family protein [Eubacteriaceae bacterium]|nr:phosphatase PAP2 family protein [Eubacteriaceae bacterium]